MMALNVKLKKNEDGSERQNWKERMMALNAETEERDNDGSERQN